MAGRALRVGVDTMCELVVVRSSHAGRSMDCIVADDKCPIAVVAAKCLSEHSSSMEMAGTCSGRHEEHARRFGRPRVQRWRHRCTINME